jgi:6-phosphogluconate dehydrogenase
MKIGFVGLGKMGAKMTERLLHGGHEVAVYDKSSDGIKEMQEIGAIAASSREDLVKKLPEKKIIWLMVPSGKPIDESLETLLPLMNKGDIIIDGGNSNWRESQKRAVKSEKTGIYFIDCGTSGGVWGLENGYCLMYGGELEPVKILEPIFKTLAPENGYIHCGPCGSGHFTKMVHNAIEYGMMQAYAEGFELMQNSEFDFNLEGISKTWMHGSVIRSWLLELAGNALSEDPKLDSIKDYVQDSGEGRWALQSAIDLDTPVPVLAASLFTRFRSRQEETFSGKMLAALRQQFGGHSTKKNT